MTTNHSFEFLKRTLVYPSHVFSLQKLRPPSPPGTVLCSDLCFPPAISHSVHTSDAGNENDAMSLSIEATEGSFLAYGRLHLFA